MDKFGFMDWFKSGGIGLFNDMNAVGEAFREHCRKTGIEPRYKDVQRTQVIPLGDGHLHIALPVTTGIEEVSPSDPTLRTIARVFLAYRHRNGSSALFSAFEQETKKGQSLYDAVKEPELFHGFTSAIVIWTEIRRTLLGSSILGVRHWVEVLYRPEYQ